MSLCAFCIVCALETLSPPVSPYLHSTISLCLFLSAHLSALRYGQNGTIFLSNLPSPSYSSISRSATTPLSSPPSTSSLGGCSPPSKIKGIPTICPRCHFAVSLCFCPCSAWLWRRVSRCWATPPKVAGNHVGRKIVWCRFRVQRVFWWRHRS